MHWTEFTTFDDSHTATESAFWDAGIFGQAVNQAMCATESHTPKVRNVPNKSYSQQQIAPARLAVLIDHIATIPFRQALHYLDCSEIRSCTGMIQQARDIDPEKTSPVPLI